MHCMEEELVDTRKKSSEAVADTRFDSHRQISEMEDMVYAKADKSEEARRASY